MEEILENLNLCDELVKEMHKQNMSDESIAKVTEHRIFKDVYQTPPLHQRIYLTTLLYKILISNRTTPPQEIRVYLNSATSVLSWLEDIKLVVLPFIAASETEMSFFHNTAD